MTAKFQQNYDLLENNYFKFNFWINFKKFDIDLQKEQLKCFKRVLSLFSFYTNFLYNYNDSQKFKFFSPRFRILNKDNKPKIFSSDCIKMKMLSIGGSIQLEW